MKKGCTFKEDFVNNNMKGSVNLGEFLPLITTSTTSTGTTSNVVVGVGMSEQPSSRWNPTAEQLLALEEMYRRGTRTPSADQIQQIASQLRRFGKIEGKNVFYWFQNHKARERQKRRREANTTTSSKLRNYINDQAPILLDDNKYSGLKPSFQLQQKKSLLVSPNFTENLEGPFAMHRGAGTAQSTVSHNACSTEKNDTWHDSKTRLTLNNNIEESFDQVETLELFPVCKSEESNNIIRRRKLNNIKDRRVPTRPINNNQYFQFLN